MTRLVVRDERESAVDLIADRLAAIVLSFGILAIVAWRAFVDSESSWDLLGLLILSGLVGTGYRFGKRATSGPADLGHGRGSGRRRTRGGRAGRVPQEPLNPTEDSAASVGRHRVRRDQYRHVIRPRDVLDPEIDRDAPEEPIVGGFGRRSARQDELEPVVTR
jgi:hypothetical protein